MLDYMGWERKGGKQVKIYTLRYTDTMDSYDVKDFIIGVYTDKDQMMLDYENNEELSNHVKMNDTVTLDIEERELNTLFDFKDFRRW